MPSTMTPYEQQDYFIVRVRSSDGKWVPESGDSGDPRYFNTLAEAETALSDLICARPGCSWSIRKAEGIIEPSGDEFSTLVRTISP